MDIGANVGCFAVLMGYLAGRQEKVIAYEANPEMYALLCENVAMNYLKPQTTFYNKAIYQIQVDAEPLDVHLNSLKHADLVKIDIEGGEYDALLACRD